MSSNDDLIKNMQTITSAITPKFLKALGVTTIKPVSVRTIRIDLKTARPDGTNMIKVTLFGGTFMVKGYKIEETDLIDGVYPQSLETAIKNIGTII